MYNETGSKGDGAGFHTDAGDVLHDVCHVERHNHVKAGKFAIFIKEGSTIKMFEPSSPSSAVSEFRSALPSGRHDVYTGNIAVRDYLEEYGYYDNYYSGVDIGGGARAHRFTAWEKM